MTDQEKIVDLESRLAEQTRRAEVAEAWQKRLTSLLAQSRVSTLTPADRGGQP